MHEVGIAAVALQETREQARRAGAARVSRIELRFGELAGGDPEALRFAFTALVPGTIAAEALLEIERVGALARCAICAEEFVPSGAAGFACPRCGGSAVEWKRGRELELARLEMVP
jgi:hydrogenase nickel incorporation protein HypA/HybF